MLIPCVEGVKVKINSRNHARKLRPIAKKEVLDPSEVARIEEVLTRVGKRVQLAAKMGVAESRISEYKAGKRRPTAEGWLALGRLALEFGLPDPFFFWHQARVDRQSLRLMANKITEDESHLTGDTIAIPRFRETERGREEAGPPVPLPLEFIPSPATTICLYVDDRSFGVVDAPRGLIILDTCILGAADVRPLQDHVVMVSYEPESQHTIGRKG